MRLLRSRAIPVALSLGAGVILGFVGPIADKWENPFCAAIATIFSGGWPWGGYAFLVGFFRRSKIESALLASLGLAVAVVVYYAFKDVSPVLPAGAVRAERPVGQYGGEVAHILPWGIAAFFLGAPCGILGNLARISGLGGLAFRLTVPFVAFCETSVRLSGEAREASSTAVATWNVVRVSAVLIALALVGHAIWRARDRRRQLPVASPESNWAASTSDGPSPRR